MIIPDDLHRDLFAVRKEYKILQDEQKVLDDRIRDIMQRRLDLYRKETDIKNQITKLLESPPGEEQSKPEWTFCTEHLVVVDNGNCIACNGDRNLIQVMKK